MTYLRGIITTRSEQHRLHDILNNFLISLSALSIAFEALNGRLPTENTCTTIDSFQFDMKIKVANRLPLVAALKGDYPDAIEVDFVSGRESGVRVGEPAAFQDVLTDMMVPVFSKFFEDNRSWMDAEFGNTRCWPPIFNFGRVIRNSLSHGRRINFTNPNADPVSWYGITYGPTDNGTKISLAMTIGDLLILMFEISDELDRLGAPIY